MAAIDCGPIPAYADVDVGPAPAYATIKAGPADPSEPTTALCDRDSFVAEVNAIDGYIDSENPFCGDTQNM
jgi:hypothetical protein